MNRTFVELSEKHRRMAKPRNFLPPGFPNGDRVLPHRLLQGFRETSKWLGVDPNPNNGRGYRNLSPK